MPLLIAAESAGSVQVHLQVQDVLSQHHAETVTWFLPGAKDNREVLLSDLCSRLCNCGAHDCKGPGTVAAGRCHMAPQQVSVCWNENVLLHGLESAICFVILTVTPATF